MKLIFKSAIFAVLIGILLIQPAAAQDKTTGAQTDKSSSSAVSTKSAGLVFPEVDGWQKGAIRTFPTPELGYSIPYQSEEGGTVTVYVYNSGLKNIPNGATDALIKDEIERAKKDIYTIGKIGVYENVKEVKSDTITLGGSAGKVKSLYSLFSFSIKGEEATSEIYLFGHDNNFIKIRATRPKEKEGTVNKALANLLAAFDTMLSK